MIFGDLTPIAYVDLIFGDLTPIAYVTPIAYAVTKLENGAWNTSTVADMSILKRLSEHIQRLSQPFKSNHIYF